MTEPSVTEYVSKDDPGNWYKNILRSATITNRPLKHFTIDLHALIQTNVLLCQLAYPNRVIFFEVYFQSCSFIIARSSDYRVLSAHDRCTTVAGLKSDQIVWY